MPLANGLPNVVPEVAFNTAVSFVTNTNWQSYGGEPTMGHLVQMAGLTVQNFVSAAVGMAVAAALIRRLARRTGRTIGNFWVDITRTITRILLPISFVIALVLVSQGAIQNFRHSTAAPPSTRPLRRLRTSPVARSAARRRSRNSAPTVAARSTPTRGIHSRTRLRSRTWSRSMPCS